MGVERLNESHAGTIGWIALGASVAAWDMFAPETLSHAVDRALESPKMRPIAYALGAITISHLFNVFDKLGIPQYDPYARLGDFVLKLHEK